MLYTDKLFAPCSNIYINNNYYVFIICFVFILSATDDNGTDIVDNNVYKETLQCSSVQIVNNQTIIKRKRGRPRKNVNNSNNVTTALQCSNGSLLNTQQQHNNKIHFNDILQQLGGTYSAVDFDIEASQLFDVDSQHHVNNTDNISVMSLDKDAITAIEQIRKSSGMYIKRKYAITICVY